MKHPTKIETWYAKIVVAFLVDLPDCHPCLVRPEILIQRYEGLKEKALRFDLDQAGIRQREAEAAELVELRAKVQRLEYLLQKALKDCVSG